MEALLEPPLPPQAWHELANYAYTHITTDHVAYTEGGISDAISEVIDYVDPDADSIAPLRRLDPLDEFLGATVGGARDTVPGDELQVSADSLSLVRDVFLQARAATQEANRLLDAFEEEADKMIPRPITPQLSLHSSRLADTAHSKARSSALRPAFQHISLDRVPVEDSPMPELLAFEDVLALQVTLEPAIAVLLKSFLISQRDTLSEPDAIFGEEKGLSGRPVEPSQPLSPALFPRSPSRIPAVVPALMFDQNQAILDLTRIPVVDEDSDRLWREHISVISGPHAFAPRSSPSSLPTPPSSPRSSVMYPSSTSPTSVDDVDIKLEVPLLARGNRHQQSVPVTADSFGSSFQSFIASMAHLRQERLATPQTSLKAESDEEKWNTIATEFTAGSILGLITGLPDEYGCMFFEAAIDEDEQKPIPVPDLGVPQPAPMSLLDLLQPLQPAAVRAVQTQLSWQPYSHSTEITSDDELSGVPLDISAYLVQQISDSAEALDRTFVVLDSDVEQIEAHRRVAFEIEGIDIALKSETCVLALSDTILNRNDRRRALGIHYSPIRPPSSHGSPDHATCPSRVLHEVDVDENLYWDDIIGMFDEVPIASNMASLSSTIGSDSSGPPAPDEDKLFNHGRWETRPTNDSDHDSYLPTPPPEMTATALPTVPAGIFDFLRLRAPHIGAKPFEALSIEPRAHPSKLAESTHEDVPPALLNAADSLCLPQHPVLPTHSHTYLASLSAVERSAFVRACGARSAQIVLVEREDLSGADLILDPHTAVLLVPASSLPSDLAALAERVAALGLRFEHIMILIECYPPSTALHGFRTGVPRPKALTPPVVTAVHTLRRTLAIFAATDARLAETTLTYAFAPTLADAACLVRAYGDAAETRDTSGGSMWADRAWLHDNEPEDEEWLATPPFMNRFAAAVILAGLSLDEFLDMPADPRRSHFRYFVGDQRIERLNALIAERQISLSPGSERSVGQR